MNRTLRERSKRIYLTGFMASGKSTIGPILANTLGYASVDLDHVIETHSGKTISEIFRTDGEEKFRLLEGEALREVSSCSQYVISLGGGTIFQQNNIDIILATGILVYLKASSGQLVRRLRNKVDRPILRGPEGERLTDSTLRQRIEELLASRSSTYAKADLIIDTDHSTVGKTVDEIVRYLTPNMKS